LQEEFRSFHKNHFKVRHRAILQEKKMSDIELKIADILALDRTRMAAERTLMAWVRTALSMISFGFTIYKFLQVLQEQDKLHVLRPQAPRDVGLTLTGIGTFAVIIACVQHWKYVKKLRPDQPYKLWTDLTFIVACLIAILGLLIFVSIIFRTGPLG
jgi:putative membrane protein